MNCKIKLEIIAISELIYSKLYPFFINLLLSNLINFILPLST